MTHPHIVLLDRIMTAAEAGDASDLADIYTPDAVIWHNHDDREQTVEQNARMLTRLGTWVTGLHYTDRRVTAFETGAVQQHVLRGTRASTGEEIALHACVVITVTDGRISRLDEYLDSAQAAKLAP